MQKCIQMLCLLCLGVIVSGCSMSIIRLEYDKPGALMPYKETISIEIKNDRPEFYGYGEDPTYVVVSTRPAYTVPGRQIDKVMGLFMQDALAAAGYKGIMANDQPSVAPCLIVSIKDFLGRGYNTFVMNMELDLKLVKRPSGETLWHNTLSASDRVTLIWGPGELNEGFTKMLNQAMPAAVALFQADDFKDALNQRH